MNQDDGKTLSCPPISFRTRNFKFKKRKSVEGREQGSSKTDRKETPPHQNHTPEHGLMNLTVLAPILDFRFRYTHGKAGKEKELVDRVTRE